jgi:hypothetical protein
MDSLTLLTQVRSAGLIVEAKGDQLVIRGPKRAGAIVQELARQKVSVLAMLAAEASPGSTEHLADMAVRPKSEETAHPCPTGRSTMQLQVPSDTAPATITYGGKTYEVAVMYGVWFFRVTVEAGWTSCSDESVAIVETMLQATGSCLAGFGNSAADNGNNGKNES